MLRQGFRITPSKIFAVWVAIDTDINIYIEVLAVRERVCVCVESYNFMDVFQDPPAANVGFVVALIIIQ